MSKPHRHIVTVEGSGVFPIDMLRYDHCWPRSESDSHKCSVDWAGEFRQVELLTHNERITYDRWKSFTWTVVSTRRDV